MLYKISVYMVFVSLSSKYMIKFEDFFGQLFLSSVDVLLLILLLSAQIPRFLLSFFFLVSRTRKKRESTIPFSMLTQYRYDIYVLFPLPSLSFLVYPLLYIYRSTMYTETFLLFFQQHPIFSSFCPTFPDCYTVCLFAY